MTIIHGLSKEPTSFLYKKLVNEKTYYYNGEIEEGVFIEEIVFNAIIEKYPEFKNEFFQVIVESESSTYLVTLNDSSKEDSGEDSFHFSKSEFSEDEIQKFLADFIEMDYDQLFFLTINGDTFNFKQDERSINFDSSLKDLNYEVMLSGGERFKNFLKKIYLHIIILIFIIIVPIVTNIIFSSDFITEREREMFKLNSDTRKFQKEKIEIESSIKNSSKRYQEIIDLEDLFQNKEKFNDFKKNFN